MASLEELNQNLCRICLKQNLILFNWNDEVLELCGKTYKDCYYKYTQLEQLALDPFSSMLCEMCSKELKNAYILVKKALDSYKILQERLSSIATQRFDETNKDEIVGKTLTDSKANEFETVIFEQSLHPKNENVVEEETSHVGAMNTVTANFQNVKILPTDGTKVKLKQETCKLYEVTQDELLSPQYIIEDDSKDFSASLINSFDADTDDLSKEFISESRNSMNTKNIDNEIDLSKTFSSASIDSSSDTCPLDRVRETNISKQNVNSKGKKHKSGKSHKIGKEKAYQNKVGMCSFCSKLVRGIASLKAHEETHKEHRERAESCPVCGLKFYDKKHLNGHMKVHAENRERNHKCDFCEKAFFNRGTLTIHRRIHLGQMKSCPLCSKEFFRQIDLDKHMNSHSATPINGIVKKRSRYYVYCKDCNKSMLSSSWKTHEAVHKNEPLMKCSICDKEFFCRKSCVTHMKKVHQKSSREDYDKFIINNGSRLSRLMLEQQKKIQPTVKI